MEFLPVISGILLLIVLVSFVKLDTFISFMLVCLFVGVTSGLTMGESVEAIQTGIGNTLGSLVIILGFGAILGKLVAESGAANKITNSLVKRIGIKNIQFSLIVKGFCTPDFRDHPKVINGSSELMKELLGDDLGVGARSAVGMMLPSNIAAEIEAIFELH